MFKPNRLIHRRLEGFKNFLEEGVPNGVGMALDHPGEMLQEVGNAIQLESKAVKRQLKGVMHAVTEGVIEEGVEHVLLEDLPAGPKKLAWELGSSVKGLLWDTPKNLIKGKPKEAAKSFVGRGLLGAIASPFKAVWWQGKGLLNAWIDSIRGVGAAFGHIIGTRVKTPEEGGGMGLQEYGLVKGLGSFFEGLGVGAMSFLGTRLRENMSQSVWRADVTMRGRAEGVATERAANTQ